MIQCTLFENPRRTINTEYGAVWFKVWLEKELKRIGNGEIKRNRLGQVALWVSRKGLELLDCKDYSGFSKSK